MSLEALRDLGVLSPLDVHLSRTLVRLADERRKSVLLAVALLSRAVRNGHVCLDLGEQWLRHVEEIEQDLDSAMGDQNAGALKSWLRAQMRKARDAVGNSPLTGRAEEHSPADCPGEPSPLVLDDSHRLYLRRYWAYEQSIVRKLRERAEQIDEAAPVETIQRVVARLFAQHPQEDKVDWQLTAALVACRRRLCVITGGPGTGKTTTAAKLLLILTELAREQGKAPLRIHLAASTGKAAARLKEAMIEAANKKELGLSIHENTKELLPKEAATIHRLLQPIGESDTRFRFSAQAPLPTDVLVVDECSMVDVSLFAHLLAAVPPTARLVLLGDEHQLASVEPGAIFGDVCDRGQEHAFSAEQAEWLERASGGRLAGLPSQKEADGPLADCIVRLRRNYRFREDRGIGALAGAIKRGDAAEAWRILQEAGSSGELGLAPEARQQSITLELREAVKHGFVRYLQRLRAATMSAQQEERVQAMEQVLAEFARYRVLCPHRHGPAGVSFLNWQIEAVLEAAGLLEPRRPHQSWYPGRPVLVTENDYVFRLFNGDLGIAVRTARGERGEGTFEVVFRGTDAETVRFLPVLRLPAHQTAFAMTVHKSQGSEFDRVDVVLPDRVSPVLTRELLYTAVTRAKQRVVLHTNEAVLKQTVERRVERSSGLRDGLWRRS